MKPKPTLKEKISVYEQLFLDLHFHRTVTMDNGAIMKILDRISAWCEVQRKGNKTDKEHQEAVNAKFWDLES